MLYAKVLYYQRLNASLPGILSTEGVILAAPNPQTGALEQTGTIQQSDYVNVSEVTTCACCRSKPITFGQRCAD